MKLRLATTILIFPVMLVAQTPASAPRPIARAVRLTSPPVLDGRLDDPAWRVITPVSGFVQHEPREGAPATQRTEVRIAFDAEALYFGVRMFDADPSGIVVGEVRRDANLADQDAFVIVLDTYGDRQNGFVFGTTPAGIEHDGQVTKDGEGGFGGPTGTGPGSSGQTGVANLNWDGTWAVKAAVDSLGWTAEFRIPFATLRYGGGKVQEWGLNFARSIRRRNEEDFWSPVGRQFAVYRISQAGSLEAVEPPTRRVTQITPYGLGTLRRDFLNAASTDASVEFGADAKLGLSPSMMLDLTYNTDFAQVEADELQINLTRFNLFFPEKRPFFLENAGTFALGTPQSMELFFSRRIGIGSSNREVPLLGGARLTGRVAGMTMGLLDIQSKAVDAAGGVAIAPNNYSVARVIKELPNRSRIGAMAVSRLNTDSTGDYNVTVGGDARIGLGESVSIDLWGAHSETPTRSGASNAVNLTGTYTTRRWELGGAFRQVDQDFNPEVGYLERPSFRFFNLRVLRHLRTPGLSWFREARPHITFRQYDHIDGQPQSRLIHIDSHYLFANGAFMETPINLMREGLQAPFEIAKGVILPPGVYDWVEWNPQFNTNLSAPYSLTGQVTVGGFYSGHRISSLASVTARPNDKFNASLRVSYDRVRLEEGKFTRVLVGLRLAYTFTPRIYLQSLIQHSNQTHILTANVRFGWLGPAGTGLFVVYNDLRETAANERPLERALLVKFTRQLGN